MALRVQRVGVFCSLKVFRIAPRTIKALGVQFKSRVPHLRCQVTEDFSSLLVRDWNAEDSRPDFQSLTEDEVTDRVQEAAGYISVLDDLRPMDRGQFNAAYEIWKVISLVPPEARPRLLDELDAGCIRALWKHSVSRYVLDDERCAEIYSGHSVWDDLPASPGQVFTFQARCEQFVLEAPVISIDAAKQVQDPRASPWLTPSSGKVSVPQKRFKQLMFVHPKTGELFCRTVLPWWGGLDRWWVPIYSRMNIELELTPIEIDAGADLTLVYPVQDPKQQKVDSTWTLDKRDLPNSSWPAPRMTVVSPFSNSSRDFVRLVGPGVYVGCGYQADRKGVLCDEDFVYFLMIRQM